MATETYKYFRPDTNLRAAYGGGAAQFFGDSKEITPRELTLRWVCKQFGLPAGTTRYLWEVGVATDTFVWIRVTDLFYSAMSAYLSAAELATVQSTAPAGWAKSSNFGILQPNPDKITLVVRGDSISDGIATTSGNTRDTWYAQAIGLIAGETLVWEDTNNNEGRSKSYQIINMSLGSSSWANTVGQPLPDDTNKATVYPRREDLAFNQRTETLPLHGPRMKFCYFLGTNDLAYDNSLSAADVWTRALTGINAFRAEFPATPLALWTIIKRTESTTLNSRIATYNNLVRANSVALGYTVFDIEAKVPQMNITFGDTTNRTYYADDVHPSTVGNAVAAAVLKDDLVAWLNAA